MESLQERLKAVRGAMTQSEFATRLRTPLTTLGRYERGANMPDLAFIINVCTIFDVSPEWLLFGRGVMREQSKEYPSSGCGCRQCPLVLKELDEERTERRELSVENRQLYAENRKLLQENGRLREELARLRPFSLGAGRGGAFGWPGGPRRFPPHGTVPAKLSHREPSPPSAVEGGDFSRVRRHMGPSISGAGKTLIAEAGHGVRIPFAGACGRWIFSGSCAGCLSGRESGDSG